MASKHTPGPWDVARYSNYEGFSIWAPGAGCIAERWSPSEDRDTPFEANARLIAAAPELLEACRAMLTASEIHGAVVGLFEKPAHASGTALASEDSDGGSDDPWPLRKRFRRCRFWHGRLKTWRSTFSISWHDAGCRCWFGIAPPHSRYCGSYGFRYLFTLPFAGNLCGAFEKVSGQWAY
jgi:hypothetical protein